MGPTSWVLLAKDRRPNARLVVQKFDSSDRSVHHSCKYYQHNLIELFDSSLQNLPAFLTRHKGIRASLVSPLHSIHFHKPVLTSVENNIDTQIQHEASLQRRLGHGGPRYDVGVIMVRLVELDREGCRALRSLEHPRLHHARVPRAIRGVELHRRHFEFPGFVRVKGHIDPAGGLDAPLDGVACHLGAGRCDVDAIVVGLVERDREGWTTDCLLEHPRCHPASVPGAMGAACEARCHDFTTSASARRKEGMRNGVGRE